ncbi:MAG: ribonuclease E [Planctomycetota bacterium]|jgi:ribonuclease E
MKRILINATQTEELRVAMVNGQKLYDLDIEVPSREQKKSNIYKGKITRVEPSLEAAFVNYGADRHGFLPFKEISKQYFGNAPRDDNGKPIIKDALKVDQEIIVQVEKEERGNKGAALTSFISLAGRFLVAMPQNPKAGGVSRRIEGEDRDELKKVLAELNMPEGMGVIVRTAGVGRSTEEMQWDLDYLTQVWTAIEEASTSQPAPFLIYQESDIVIRALRDHYRTDIGEIIIDSEAAFKQAHDFMTMVMPGSINKLKRFEEKIPLFNRFQIENQIESAFSREVTLPSGGAIVIDHTEALTSIDINSARATKGSDIEETARQTNLEAADEVARQLRIRDLGGLVVIDFIDMMQNKNQREVESRLRNAVYEDRARVQIGRISRFGLLEMSRQRLRPSLEESSQIVCPRCSGQGTIRDVESLSLAVLRLLEDESLKDHTGKILAKMPVECATYLLNEKREKIDGIEQRLGVHIVVIPDPKLETPHYVIERVKDSDTHRHESNYKKSYELTTEEEPVDLIGSARSNQGSAEQAAVKRIEPPTPRPSSPAVKASSNEPGIVGKLMGMLFGGSSKEEPKKEEKKEASSGQANRGNNRTRRPRNRNNQNRNRKSEGAKGNDNNDGNSNEAEVKQAATEKTETSDNNRGGQSRSGRSRNSNRSGNRNNRGRQQDNQAKKEDGDNPDSKSGDENSAEQKPVSNAPPQPGNTNPAVQSSPVENATPSKDTANKPAETTAHKSEDSKPSGNTRQPSGNNRQASEDSQQPSGNIRSASENSEQPSGNTRQPSGNNHQPAEQSGNVKSEVASATTSEVKDTPKAKPASGRPPRAVKKAAMKSEKADAKDEKPAVENAEKASPAAAPAADSGPAKAETSAPVAAPKAVPASTETKPANDPVPVPKPVVESSATEKTSG